jgi:hypothetical protein
MLAAVDKNGERHGGSKTQQGIHAYRAGAGGTGDHDASFIANGMRFDRREMMRLKLPSGL